VSSLVQLRPKSFGQSITLILTECLENTRIATASYWEASSMACHLYRGWIEITSHRQVHHHHQHQHLCLSTLVLAKALHGAALGISIARPGAG